MAALAPAYRPRRPTETVLYAVARDHLETFLAHARDTYSAPLPRYVEEELRGYLRCGVFAHGFVLCRCDECGHDLLVADPRSEHEGPGGVEAPPREEGAVVLDGFNLHASVAIAGDDDLGRERLMRYGARPPLALDRLRRLPNGRIAYRIKKLREGRGKHRVMTPLEFLARLAAIVPPPRFPLLRYAGVLAPASRWRSDVAPPFGT